MGGPALRSAVRGRDQRDATVGRLTEKNKAKHGGLPLDFGGEGIRSGGSPAFARPHPPKRRERERIRPTHPGPTPGGHPKHGAPAARTAELRRDYLPSA